NQMTCGEGGAELADQHLDDLVRYISLLGVPARRNHADTEGPALFEAAGCDSCHRPSLRTSPYHPLAELRDQTIHPYTDLLLHDMGEGLADNLGEALASGAAFVHTMGETKP
ncbi:MAG TPA: di-heme oxidoredictase family protein, partial [Myxococcota bacterium]|nr:di-heme oxidoredictase family protein [Myxococcota bacterium]